MSDLSFGRRYSRGFQKFYDGVHLVTGVLAVVLLFAALLDKEQSMRYFPLILLDAAALNLVCAYANIKTSYRQRRQKAAGVGYLIWGLLLVVLAAVVAICIW